MDIKAVREQLAKIVDLLLATLSNDPVETEDDTLLRLCELVVSALELGRGKQEDDVAHELFDSFGADLGAVIDSVAQSRPNRLAELRTAAATALAGAATTPEALILVLVGIGGRFINMVGDIYQWLADESATTSGPVDEFRLRLREDELDLPISAAFVEEVQLLRRELVTVQIAQFDFDSIQSLTGYDGGEFYGHWPIRSRLSRALLDSSLRLESLEARIGRTGRQKSHWGRISPDFDRARQSVGRLVQEAEAVVLAYGLYLERYANVDTMSRQMEGQDSLSEPVNRRLDRELDLFRSTGLIGSYVDPRYYVEIDGPRFVGLNLRGTNGRVSERAVPVELDEFQDHAGSSMSQLATFVAIARLGMTPERRWEQVDEMIGGGPSAVSSWLNQVASDAGQTAEWLRSDVLAPFAETTVEREVSLLDKFLNLPLWKHRDVLYEIWLLCETAKACARAGWQVNLRLERSGRDVWVLPISPTAEPVADLVWKPCRPDQSTLEAALWREPRMSTGSGGDLTPDVAVTTTTEPMVSLAVVEAKDKFQMASGELHQQRRPSKASAAAVGLKYVEGIQPIVTWVCNHCDMKGDPDPRTNQANPWRQLYLGSGLRPGEVPPEFSETIAKAVTPPDGASL